MPLASLSDPLSSLFLVLELPGPEAGATFCSAVDVPLGARLIGRLGAGELPRPWSMSSDASLHEPTIYAT